MAARFHQPLYLLDKMTIEDVLGFFFHAAQRIRAANGAPGGATTSYCDQVNWL